MVHGAGHLGFVVFFGDAELHPTAHGEGLSIGVLHHLSALICGDREPLELMDTVLQQRHEADVHVEPGTPYPHPFVGSSIGCQCHPAPGTSATPGASPETVAFPSQPSSLGQSPTVWAPTLQLLIPLLPPELGGRLAARGPAGQPGYLLLIDGLLMAEDLGFLGDSW